MTEQPKNYQSTTLSFPSYVLRDYLKFHCYSKNRIWINAKSVDNETDLNFELTRKETLLLISFLKNSIE